MAPAYTRAMKRISHLEIPANAVLVDVRDELDALAMPLSHLSDLRVIHAPLGDLEDGVSLALPEAAPLLVVCASGQRSELAGAYLLADGASQVYLLEGGVRAWRHKLEAAPLETPLVEVLPLEVLPLETLPLETAELTVDSSA